MSRFTEKADTRQTPSRSCVSSDHVLANGYVFFLSYATLHAASEWTRAIFVCVDVFLPVRLNVSPSLSLSKSDVISIYVVRSLTSVHRLDAVISYTKKIPLSSLMLFSPVRAYASDDSSLTQPLTESSLFDLFPKQINQE